MTSSTSCEGTSNGHASGIRGTSDTPDRWFLYQGRSKELVGPVVWQPPFGLG